MSAAWQSQAYLDALRPPPAGAVTGAILTSYSADLVSIVAALLALAGRDDEEGNGGKTDLAEAVELLRGKVRILIQRGRLGRPKRIPALAGILDQSSERLISTRTSEAGIQRCTRVCSITTLAPLF